MLIDLDWEGSLDVRGTMRSPCWDPNDLGSADAYSVRALVSYEPNSGEHHAEIQTLLDEKEIECTIYELSDFNDGHIFRGSTAVVKIIRWI